ncbi:major facilitator superfamily domain-containing protein [Scheffersomyces coipomensis]|uniref:major facilitator superfamily domain-containing protein n=1 Tax=Scheffersomyces coipomensis TaxID=1788519 RepID=UPI00315D7EEC
MPVAKIGKRIEVRENPVEYSGDDYREKKGANEVITLRSMDSSSDEESLSSKNPFLDPKVVEYYRQVYSAAHYESYEAFDPNFTWTQEEENKLLRKLNIRVALAACVLFVSLQVDRGNLAQAVTDNMLPELGLTTDNYNTGNTIALVTFLLAEVPSQLISKRLGPDIFIPIQIVIWSIVATSQAALKGKASFYATRGIIGALQGGFIADLVLWLSYFFTSKELSTRLSWFWTTLSLVTIFTSILAFGILRLGGKGGLSGWRWLFLIEGLFTFVIGVLSFYLMVPSAVQTKNKLHPKGWFTDREVKIVVNRVLRDDPSKGTMHNRQALGFKMIFKSLMDYDLWPIYAIGLLAYIGQGTFTAYFGLLNKQLGFNTFTTNILTVPTNVIHIILLLFITWLSEFLNERSLTCTLAPIYTVPIIAAIRWWPGSGKEKWTSYVLNTLYLGQPYIHAICVSWASRNSNSVRTRSISSAVYNMFCQLGNVAAANIYRTDDLPLYHRGNMQLVFIGAALIPLLILTKIYYVWRNNKRDKLWNALSPEEREDYITNTNDEGNKRLDFRFDH